jgi:integrase
MAMATGIEVRHRKRCTAPRDDGKCCGASFQAQAYDARAGKPIKKSFSTRAAARQWRHDAQHALRNGDHATVKPSGRTVQEALDALVEGMRDGTILDRSGRRYRPATARSYQQAAETYLKPSLGRLRLSEVRRADVQRLIDRMHAGGLSGSTIRNKLDPLRVVYRRAIQDEEVTRTPTEYLRFPALKTKPRRVAGTERVGDLLAALPDSERAAWACAFYAGMRVGELRALRWSAVDFDQGVIRVLAGWDDAEGEQETKTEAGTRTVPLAGRLRALMAAHKLATGRDGDDLVFGRTAREAFVRSTLRARALRAWGWKQAPNPEQTGPRMLWVKARPDALEPLTPHEGRHCCASYLAKAGLTIKEAQEALGHADPRTTMAIYQHALPGWQEQAVAKLDAYLATARRAPA